MSGNSDWLPPGYEAPSGGDDHFMRLASGPNRLRVLSRPLIYLKGWLDNGQGGQSAVRVRSSESGNMPAHAVDVRECWALKVFAVDAGAVQILEIQQTAILRALADLARDGSWGDPRKFGLVINKTGAGLNSRYTVQPRPPQPLPPAISKIDRETPVRLEALLEPDGDPFAPATPPPRSAAAHNAAQLTPPTVGAEELAEDLPF